MTWLRKAWDWIAHLWKNPDGYYGRPIKYAINQGPGHFVAVGFIPVAVFDFSILILLIGFGVWEVTQWHFRGADPYDCVEDWCFVAAGALSGLHWIMTLLIVPVALVFWANGVLLRIKERRDGL
ncbi:hypothetical protein [uncultured Roseobacter sp.]|uniref:hypothetical protein n=1 Tax=uncultured Roseobacter sp. TaxID=114847 RepID=UPI002636BA61|nr:hypothetical protein [uncultured Roseobacter sp.]